MFSASYFKFQVNEGLAASRDHFPITNGVATDPRSCHVREAHVYRDADGVIFSVVLTKTDVENRKNSYHKIQILESDDASTGNSSDGNHWLFQTKGEIGAVGYMCSETPMLRTVAVMEFEQTFLELTGNLWENRNKFKKILGKMVMLDLEDKDTGNCQLEDSVQKLINVLFNLPMSECETVPQISVKWPLGRLSEKQMEGASETLGRLFEYVLEQDGEYSDLKTVIRYTNQFYSLLPRAAINSLPLLDTIDAIQKEYDFLDKLKSIELDTTCPVVTKYYTQLNTMIRPLNIAEPLYEVLRKCVQNTCTTISNVKCVQIFEVQRHGEKERFVPFERSSNRKLLWHGTRVGNISAILSQGNASIPYCILTHRPCYQNGGTFNIDLMCIAGLHTHFDRSGLRITGVARGGTLGTGIYFADMISKSLQYCGGPNSIDHTIFLLLCEVALGTNGSDSNNRLGQTVPDPKDDIILEKGLVLATGRPSTSGYLSLSFNEYVVFNEAQVKIRYLVQIK